MTTLAPGLQPVQSGNVSKGAILSLDDVAARGRPAVLYNASCDRQQRQECPFRDIPGAEPLQTRCQCCHLMTFIGACRVVIEGTLG